MSRVYGFGADHFFLSNFFVESDGLTGEHRFQREKTFDPVWRERILSAPTPAKAKYHGRSVPLRSDWEDVKGDVMQSVIRAKFSDAVNPGLAARLLATGDAELVEANRWNDRYWGVDESTGEGLNHLGVTLMAVRTELRHPAAPSNDFVTVATDGSAAPTNPGPAGWAWYVNDYCWAAGAAAHSTNNRAELAAVLNLFRATAADNVPLHIVLDSKYAIGVLSGHRVHKNVDLVEKILAATRGRTYELEWVKGHAGHQLNEAVDERCSAASAAMHAGLNIPSGPGWSSLSVHPHK